MSSEPLVVVHRTPFSKRSREFGLVLRAKDVHFIEGREGREHVLLVAQSEELAAVEEFRRYEEENVGWPPKPEQVVLVSTGLGAVAAWILTLWTFFLFDQSDTWGYEWVQRGLSRAGRVLDGEWWRPITALTMHSGWSHLASNVVFGALFLVLVAQLVGNGAALFSALLSGALGNLLNAWIQRPEHGSIGASTAVFGLIGVLAAHQWIRRRRVRHGFVYRWAPLVLGGVFLGWMGTGGERTDVLAHCTGLLTGGFVGAALGTLEPRRFARRGAQIGLALASIAILAAAWSVALTSP